jgi:hypothetical protein
MVLAVLAAIAAVVTAVWPTWIETLTRLDPDGGSGETEWQLVVALVVVTVAAAVLARRDLRAVRRTHGTVT